MRHGQCLRIPFAFETSGPVAIPDPWHARLDLAASVSDARERAGAVH
jgi:hypothetical protein